MRKHAWLGSLGSRLFITFFAVSMTALALLTAIAAVSVDQRSTRLAQQQRDRLRSDVAAALAAAYTAGRGSWSTADLSAIKAVARSEDVEIVVLDVGQGVVSSIGPSGPAGPRSSTSTPNPSAPGHTQGPQPTAAPTGFGSQSGAHTSAHQEQPGGPTASASPDQHRSGSAQQSGRAGESRHNAAAGWSEATPSGTTTPTSAALSTTSVPIIVNGTVVGTARLVFPTALPEPVAAARTALLRSLAIGSALAVIVAAAGAAFVSRRLSRPLLALADATRSFAAGEEHPESRLRRAPGELGEVAHAFSQMARTVRRQDELRRAVIADVAHELRTPVTILRGQTELLLDGIAEPTVERLVSLHDEVLRLARLTDDLAALSAADAAGLTLQPEALDLAELARQTVSAITPQFDDAQVGIELNASAAVAVNADPGRLTQVITNLLTNAVKFTPAGGRVLIGVTRSGPSALLTVEDTGPGIPAEELPHVFDRFWRGRAAGARSGSGIGLAVVHTLVSAHGGTVSASSPPGHGAQFTVVIPAADTSND